MGRKSGAAGGARRAEGAFSGASMVTFLTFFLGLTIGVQPVEVAVHRSVAAIELRLDGEVVGVVSEAPWRVQCDFGQELMPHLLEAIAYDERGRELGRVEQRINLLRPEAEVALVLSDYREGRYRQAEIVWQVVDESAPDEVLVDFDGEGLEVVDKRFVTLPAHNPERIHILSIELLFSGDRRAQAELAFGGQYGEAVSTELTAVAVDVLDRKALRVDRLQGWFLARGEPVRVVAVEDGRAEVVAVRDRSALPKLKTLGLEAWSQARAAKSPRSRGSAEQYLAKGLSRGDSLHLVGTVPEDISTAAGKRTTLFSIFPDANKRSKGGIAYTLTQFFLANEALGGPQLLPEAVAIAGLLAAGSNRARAVVLVLGEDSKDRSSYDPRTVVSFLAVLRVPFFVWRVGDGNIASPAWGEGSTITKLKELNRSVRELRDQLKQQAIVWLDGDYLPQEISLAPAAGATIRLAGGRS